MGGYLGILFPYEPIVWLELLQFHDLTLPDYIFRKQSTLKEQMMLGWGPGNLNLLFMLLADFLINPEAQQHMYSCVPPVYSQSIIIFLLYFLYDVVTIAAFVITGLFECQLEYLVIQTLINWTAEIRFC